MPFKSFYTEDLRWTAEARSLEESVFNTLKDLFKTYVDKGYNPRDISHILCSAVSVHEIDAVMDIQEKYSHAELKVELIEKWGVNPADLENLSSFEMNTIRNKIRRERFQAKVDEIKEKKETQQPLCL